MQPSPWTGATVRTDEPRVPHVAGPENAGVEGLNVEDSRVIPHRGAAVVDGRRTDSTGEGDRMPPSPSATVRATPPVWPEVWYVWWSRAGTEARMAPRTVELVPKYSKPHEPTRPAATHADLREDRPRHTQHDTKNQGITTIPASPTKPDGSPKSPATAG